MRQPSRGRRPRIPRLVATVALLARTCLAVAVTTVALWAICNEAIGTPPINCLMFSIITALAVVITTARWVSLEATERPSIDRKVFVWSKPQSSKA
jgi:hypothetical protein